MRLRLRLGVDKGLLLYIFGKTNLLQQDFMAIYLGFYTI